MTQAPRQRPPVTLALLEAELEAAGARLFLGEASADARVSDVTQDSRQVKAGSLFVARRGGKSDGTKFAGEALAKGAPAVLCEVGTVTVTPRIEVRDLTLAYGLASHAVQGRPSAALSVIGVTGTNGKTTTACLVESALFKLGARPARLGTLGFAIDGVTRGGTLTTPQADDVARFMAEARDAGATHFVMEVSSHALDQGRVLGVRFEVGAFTNLTQDHLDYHGTMEAYGSAKRRLFTELRPEHAVVNADDSFGAVLAHEIPGALAVSRTGEPGEVGLHVRSFAQAPSGLSAELVVNGTPVQLRSRLVGLHNLDNLLVALGCLVSLGYEARAAADALGSAPAVPGRLERCDAEDDDVLVLVDYAHTPDALERALSAVAGLTRGNLVCVFGCGGDRDRGKRPLMGRAAGAGASRVVVTSDNPRSEDPARIIDDILPGLAGARASVSVQVDRAVAIEEAIAQAEPGDVVLLAGKGHETYQLIGDRTLDFDDRVEARKALAGRRAARGGVR